LQGLKISSIFLLVFLYSFYPNETNAQVNVNSVGVDLGIIHSVEYNSRFIGNNPSLFPEFYLGGDFIEPYLNWKLNLGYWNDGKSESKSNSQYPNVPDYSYSGFVISTEMIYLLPDSNPNHPSPFRVLAGLSYHHISAKDIDRYESGSIYKKDYSDNLFYFNTGLELHLFIKNYLSVFTKGIMYLKLNKNEEHSYNATRFQLSLGLNYQFND